MGWGGGISGSIRNALKTEAANEVDRERKDLVERFNKLIKREREDEEEENQNGGSGSAHF